MRARERKGKKKRLVSSVLIAHTHLLHRCAHIPCTSTLHTIGYCLLSYKNTNFFSLALDFHISFVFLLWWFASSLWCCFCLFFPPLFDCFVCLLFLMLSLSSFFDILDLFPFFNVALMFMFSVESTVLTSALAHIYTRMARERTNKRASAHSQHPLRHKVLCLCITLTHIRFLW